MTYVSVAKTYLNVIYVLNLGFCNICLFYSTTRAFLTLSIFHSLLRLKLIISREVSKMDLMWDDQLLWYSWQSHKSTRFVLMLINIFQNLTIDALLSTEKENHRISPWNVYMDSRKEKHSSMLNSITFLNTL